MSMNFTIPNIAITTLCALTLQTTTIFSRHAFAAESEVQSVSELTAELKSWIDAQMQRSLANPRVDAPGALSRVQKIGPGALIYASRETAKLLFIPEQINPEAGFDLLLMQVLRNLRHSEKLGTETIVKLNEIAISGNQYHENFAKEVVILQEEIHKK